MKNFFASGLISGGQFEDGGLTGTMGNFLDQPISGYTGA
jgi:hypothetical protein